MTMHAYDNLRLYFLPSVLHLRSRTAHIRGRGTHVFVFTLFNVRSMVNH